MQPLNEVFIATITGVTIDRKWRGYEADEDAETIVTGLENIQ